MTEQPVPKPNLRREGWINLSAFVASLVAIGAGVAAHDWGAALAVVGAIVLCTVVGSRLLSLRKPAQEAKNEST